MPLSQHKHDNVNFISFDNKNPMNERMNGTTQISRNIEKYIIYSYFPQTNVAQCQHLSGLV